MILRDLLLVLANQITMIRRCFKYGILVGILLIGLVSCEPDGLKLPTDLYITFSVVNEMTSPSDEPGNEDGNPNIPDNVPGLTVNGQKQNKSFYHRFAEGYFLTIDSASLRLRNIYFEGERQEGADYSFTSDFDEPLAIEFMKEKKDSVHFDVPQGQYQSINVSIETDSLNNAQPGFTLKGKYNSANRGNIPLEFQFFDHPEIISLQVNKKKALTDTFIMKTGEKSYVEIQLNLKHILEDMRGRRFEQCQTIEKNGKERIVISNKLNTEIYNNVVGKTKEAFNATFYQL